MTSSVNKVDSGRVHTNINKQCKSRRIFCVAARCVCLCLLTFIPRKASVPTPSCPAANGTPWFFVYKSTPSAGPVLFFLIISRSYQTTSHSLCNSPPSLSSLPPLLLLLPPSLRLTFPPLWLPSPLVAQKSPTAQPRSTLLLLHLTGPPPLSPLSRPVPLSNTLLVPLLWLLVLCWLCKKFSLLAFNMLGPGSAVYNTNIN